MPPWRHLQRHALQHQDDVVVDDLDVLDREDRLGRALRASWQARAGFDTYVGHEWSCSRAVSEREAASAASLHFVSQDRRCAQLSLEQSRGVIFFSAAYLADTSLTSGSVISWLAVYQSEMIFHCLAVPLLDAAVARAFVVGAGDLDRLHHAFEAQLLDARRP